MSIKPDLLSDYVRNQANTFFPDGNIITNADLSAGVADALARTEHCFLQIKTARYCTGKVACFDHLYSDQYLMFLWFLSNALWKRGSGRNVLNKIYLLNKCLHAFDCAFDTALPDIFIVIHGVGTVLGKAVYADYLAVYHGCTVGQTQGHYPNIGRGVGLGAGACLIGKSSIGDFASIGSGCSIVNRDVESGAVAYRDDNGQLTERKGRPAAIARQYFLDEYLPGPGREIR